MLFPLRRRCSGPAYFNLGSISCCCCLAHYGDCGGQFVNKKYVEGAAYHLSSLLDLNIWTWKTSFEKEGRESCTSESEGNEMSDLSVKVFE